MAHYSFLGCGAYFADNPKKSHDYTAPSASGQKRVMFYNKVILGKESTQAAADNKLAAAPKGLSFSSWYSIQFYRIYCVSLCSSFAILKNNLSNLIISHMFLNDFH